MKTNIKGDFRICISVPVIIICFLRMAGSFKLKKNESVMIDGHYQLPLPLNEKEV